MSAALVGFFSFRALACGPDFPNNILSGDALIKAPAASFEAELERVHLIPTRYAANPATNGFGNQTLEADLADLRAALRKAGQSTDQRRDIVERYSAERQKLMDYREQIDGWEQHNRVDIAEDPTQEIPRPKLENPFVLEELPEEFKSYFRGSVAWYSGETNTARSAWEFVLNLPETDRRFRSTWAAFMLGKSWEDDDPEKAIGYYQQVRSLAASGFADRLGLAAASLGREALMYLHLGNLEPAFNLYLEQLATADVTAVSSLRLMAARALNSDDQNVLTQLAGNPKARRVITAYLISFQRRWDSDGEDNPPPTRWLAAVEHADVHDVESAEVLALAAYQGGNWDVAQRWINRAQATPTIQWLQAKLFLRDGKTDEAGELLTKVVRLFPSEPRDTNTPPRLEDNLTMDGSSYTSSDITPAMQALAELGALHLSRREYTQSLDALLRSGFWMDAAYVAERVLTVDELKSYVDRNWPAVAGVESPTNIVDGEFVDSDPQMDVRKELRYLLARRLTRLSRSAESREYFPAEWLPPLDALTRALAAGHDETQSYEQRFQMLAAAAGITRTNGMELIGTEVEPDWHIHGGSFDYGITVSSRTNAGRFLQPTEDELARATTHGVTPEERFHYREISIQLRIEAARLGQQAVLSMPDGSDETARVLCISGTWLEDTDPKAAYSLYKTILKRCRNTKVGLEAWRTGKMPRLDEENHVVPRDPDIEDMPKPGQLYTIHAGDTFFRIIKAVNVSGPTITAEDMLAANPGLNINKLRAGKTILIPAPHEEKAQTSFANDALPTADTAMSQEPIGFNYVVHPGDTLAAIAEAMTALGSPMTVGDLLRANPHLSSHPLTARQIIYIPAPMPPETSDETSATDEAAPVTNSE